MKRLYTAGLWLGLLTAIVGWGCAAPQVRPPVAAEYGTVPGYFTPQYQFQPDAGYSLGTYAVPLAARQLLAFDTDSEQTGLCSRIDDKPFQLPNGNVQYYRFRCDGSWTSRNVIFVDSTRPLPTHGEKLEWKPLEGEFPLTLSQFDRQADLHGYVAVATPRLLNGSVLVGTSWFLGEYPPRKERDESRGDEIAFGHYRILDRELFVGRSAKEPVTFLYRANDLKDVTDALEWAFLPEAASEKTHSGLSAIYEIPGGYLLRVSEFRDHEGAGADESTHLYMYDSVGWRHLASAERIRMY